MRRIVFVLVLLLLGLWFTPVTTYAETDGQCRPTLPGPLSHEGQTTTTRPPQGSLDCAGAINPTGPSSATTTAAHTGTARSGANSVGTSQSAVVRRYIPYNRLVTGSDGQPCVSTGYYEQGTPPPNDTLQPDPVTQTVNEVHGLQPLEYPPCPEQATIPGQPVPVETPSMIAMRYWERIPLPTPQPWVAPGRAITGKLAFLETRGQVGHTYTNDTVLGPLVIVATGTYMVDWGDGESSGPHVSEGRPWPDGQIVHEYQRVGTYNIVVTERWTATWRLGGESGVLRELRTTGRIDDFPVEQIQAVIG
jgi:hypothetical protein